MTQPHTRLYPTLSQTFFQGSITGQINAIYGSYRTNPTRLTDYCRALANGDATLGHVPLSKAHCAKLAFHRELTSSLFIMCQTARSAVCFDFRGHGRPPRPTAPTAAPAFSRPAIVSQSH